MQVRVLPKALIRSILKFRSVALKHCGACGKDKDPELDFTKNRSEPDGLNHTCKGCHRVRVNKHYEQNPEYSGEKARTRSDRLKETIRLMKGKPCMDCGGSFNSWQMDFDHRDPNEKECHISRMAALGVSLERLEEEVKKCDLVCANCHRNRTHERGYSSSFRPDKEKGRWPDDDDLEQLILTKSFLAIAKIVGVSDQTVRKRYVKRGIPFPSGRFHPPK